MVRLPTLLESRQDTSVFINGLYVPIDQVKYSLERFSRPLFFYNAGSSYEVSVAGSCFLARLAGENFLIATRHQLEAGGARREEPEVCIALYDSHVGDKPTLLTPNGGVIVDESDRFQDDILMLTFVREEARLAQLSAHFLQIDRVASLGDVDPRRIIQFSTIAWPSVGNRPRLKPDGMGYEEFRTGFVRLALELHDVPTPDGHVAFRVKEAEQKIRDFDGYSGAPVYFLYQDANDQVQLGWVGIIRLGGNGILHVYLGHIILGLIASSRGR